LKKDGTVVTTSDAFAEKLKDWHDIIDIAVGFEHVAGLRKDGTVIVCDDEEAVGSVSWNGVSGWSDIIAIAAGFDCIVGLRSDRTVVYCGRCCKRQEKVSSWENVIAISVGTEHIVALEAPSELKTAENAAEIEMT
jgi:alpha-tubulin suppressor-like RCC1 family protein